jgi:hypothetical protein
MQWLQTFIQLLLIFSLGPICWFILAVLFGATADRLLHLLLGSEPAQSMYHVTNGAAAIATLGLVLWLKWPGQDMGKAKGLAPSTHCPVPTRP